MTDINTISADQLTKEQYAQRAGVPITQIMGDFGGYTVGSVSPTSPQGSAATITPESLANTSAMPVVPANQVPVYPTTTLEVPLPLEPTDQENKASGITSKLSDLYGSLVGRTADQAVADTNAGVDVAQQNINDLSAQLTILKNEAAAIPLQLEQNSTGITTGVLRNQENGRLRTNAIAALGVSSLLAASMGQLANAQAMANKAVAQKYDPILEQIGALKANLELIANDPLTSLQDKKRALAQQAAQDAKAEQVTTAKQDAAEIWNIATTAATNQASFKPSGQYTTLTTTLQAIAKAPTRQQALQIAVETGLLSETATAGSTSDVTEYNLAKSQGFTGTFQQWVDRASQYKGTGGGGTTTTTTPKFDYNTAVSRLKSVGVPVAPLNQNGGLASSYKKALLDEGLDTNVVDWLWTAVLDGNTFEEIRQEIKKNGADPRVLDTFVQALQK